MKWSDFNLKPIVEKGDCIPIEGGGYRYKFYKVRRFGRLHFKKQISKEYQEDLRTKEALRKEFEIGYGFDHPCIVRYLAYEEDALYEEYIDGLTLRQMLDNGDERLYKRGFLIDICKQLVDALAYIHSAGVVHLDIKPENVMITNVGNNVKLIDFSCARNDVFDTTEGYTERYKAPEQDKGMTNTYTDIFLVGKLMEELASYVGRENDWKWFIKRATATDPANRFQNDAEVLAAHPLGHTERKINWQIILTATVFFALIGWSITIYTDNLKLQNSVRNLNERTVSVDGSLAVVKKTMEDSLRKMRSDQGSLKINSEATPTNSTSNNAGSHAASINDKLKQDIISFVSKRYNTYVLPVVDDWNRNTGELAPGYEEKCMKSMQQSVDACITYGKSLSQKYPANAEFIETTMLEQINLHQSMYGRRQEEAYKRWFETHGHE